ncbi:hypothetical protein IQ251_01185 [Saccharopolyspora sp. HNM0983]|uniref:Uncharacterized protein n=1 Tax=Saccharopolyspora montiporae TaxID=2781240 RepID=A0A929B6A9_9PSEU|nr:hypothetical protein [Saccharopolyspora sp. HNM0983]MBE9373051.1 hypothetical protein [Saccharopolyspora sp. HNM0983]
MWLPKLPEPVDGSARADLEQRWGRARRWVLLCTLFFVALTATVVVLVSLRLSWSAQDLPVLGSKQRGLGRIGLGVPLGLCVVGWALGLVTTSGKRLLNPELWVLGAAASGAFLGWGLHNAFGVVFERVPSWLGGLMIVAPAVISAVLVGRASHVLTRPFFGALGGSGIRVAVRLRTATAKFWTEDCAWLEADELTIKVASAKSGSGASEESTRQVKLSYVLDVRTASAAGDERLWPGLDDARGVFPRPGQGLVVVRTQRAEYKLPVDEPREFARAVWLRKQMTPQLVAD